MEFTDRGVNRQDSPRIAPLSGYFTEKTHRADSQEYEFREAQHLRSSPFHEYSLASPSLHGTLDREMEKERMREEIREEMIISEMARRCAVEAEVRRELMMQMEYSAPRTVDGFSFRSSSPQMMDFVPMRRPTHLGVRGAEEGAFEGKIAPLLSRELQSESRGTEFNPVSGGGPVKQKLIVLGGKPRDENISGTKRKAESPPPPAAEANNNKMKKIKEGWYCEVCKISSNSEQSQNDHLRGRKHKSKEAALSAKNGTTTTTTKSKEAAAGNLKYPFWCDICKVGAHTEDVMLCHERGRKHVNRLGRIEAKVSARLLVNNLAEWVGAYGKKSIADENHKVVDTTESENHKLVSGEIINKDGNVDETMNDESMNPTEPENDKVVECIVVEGENISEGSNVDETSKDELVDPVEPENDAQVNKAESVNDKVVEDSVIEGENLSEGSYVDETSKDELVDPVEPENDARVDRAESENDKVVEDSVIEGENLSEGSYVDETSKGELVDPVEPENDARVDKAESENDKIVPDICNGKNVTEDGSVERPTNDGAEKEELVDDWVAYIAEPENRRVELEDD